MALRLITPPATFLLTRDEAKAALNIDFADDDALIDSLIKAAQGVIETETQRRYCAQQLEWVLDGLCDPMVLPVAPGGDCSKVAVDFVKYADLATGVMTVLDPLLYWQRPAGKTQSVVRRRFVYWPFVGDAAELAVIRFSVTSTAADAAPEVLTAMKLLVAHFYRNREAVVGADNRVNPIPLPLGVEACLTGERWS